VATLEGCARRAQTSCDNHPGGSYFFTRGKPQLESVGLSIQHSDQHIFNHGKEVLLKR
jgi:hypothetical protein